MLLGPYREPVLSTLSSWSFDLQKCEDKFLWFITPKLGVHSYGQLITRKHSGLHRFFRALLSLEEVCGSSLWEVAPPLPYLPSESLGVYGVSGTHSKFAPVSSLHCVLETLCFLDHSVSYC